LDGGVAGTSAEWLWWGRFFDEGLYFMSGACLLGRWVSGIPFSLLLCVVILEVNGASLYGFI